MNVLVQPPSLAGANLSDAFSAFISAANRLENSYQELHSEVSYLRGELEDRNRELAKSIAEVESMRGSLSNILDELPCGVVVINRRNHALILSNPEAHRLLGMPLEQVLSWETLPRHVRTALQAFDQDDSASTGEFELKLTADSWLALRYTVMKSAGAANESEQCILTLRDITAQKQAELNREATRHMVALAEVATVLAHEIRNPLGSMELMIGLLGRDPALSVDSRNWVGSLQAGVRSLSATVTNVLNFHGNGSLHLCPIKVGTALKSALDFARPLIEQAGLTLEIYEDTGDTGIAGDSAAIQQVILNLTCNALRHTPSGGRLTVRSYVEHGSPGRIVVIQFADSGSGIPPQYVTQLFEPGFSTAGQGLGLGLAVCQQIIRQHNGVVSVASQLNHGAMFHMEFPVL
jgi:two-component system sensor histidine kinase FlrB